MGAARRSTRLKDARALPSSGWGGREVSRCVSDSCSTILTTYRSSGSIAPYAPARSATRWHIDAPHTFYRHATPGRPLCATFSCAALEMHALLGSLHLPPHIRIGKDTWRAWKGEMPPCCSMYGGTPFRSILRIHIVHRLLGRGCFPLAEIFRQLASAQHSFGMAAGATGLPSANSRGRATRARSWPRHLLAAPEILIELDHGQVK